MSGGRWFCSPVVPWFWVSFSHSLGLPLMVAKWVQQLNASLFPSTMSFILTWLLSEAKPERRRLCAGTWAMLAGSRRKDGGWSRDGGAANVRAPYWVGQCCEWASARSCWPYEIYLRTGGPKRSIFLLVWKRNSTSTSIFSNQCTYMWYTQFIAHSILLYRWATLCIFSY